MYLHDISGPWTAKHLTNTITLPYCHSGRLQELFRGALKHLLTKDYENFFQKPLCRQNIYDFQMSFLHKASPLLNG